jgi:hypothetical protein
MEASCSDITAWEGGREVCEVIHHLGLSKTSDLSVGDSCSMESLLHLVDRLFVLSSSLLANEYVNNGTKRQLIMYSRRT